MGKSKKLIIFGNSDFAKLMSHYLEKEYSICAYVVDAEYKKEATYNKKPVISSDEIIEKYPPSQYKAFVAIGYSQHNSIREKAILKMESLGYDLISYIHPTSFVDSAAQIGKNCVVLEHSVLEPFCEIKKGCIIWSNVTICHDSKIEENSFIASNVCINGFVKIGKNAFIGAGSIIRDKLIIADNNIIGMGCAIQHNTKPNEVYKNKDFL